jgi:hypothetical protein
MLRTKLFALALLALLPAIAFSQALPTAVISTDATHAIAPATVRVTWSSTNATSCVASGGWSGTKALSGTQEITGVQETTTYSISCTGTAAVVDTATVSWTPPTTNSNGTPLTDLAGFRVYYGTSATNLSQMGPIVSSSTTQQTITGLTVSAWFFGVRAFNSRNIFSDMSNISSKVIVQGVAPTASASTTVTVNTRPSAPVMRAVDTVAMSVKMDWDGAFALVPSSVVGSVPLGTLCDSDRDVKGGWNKVDPESVAWSVSPSNRPKHVIARCAEVISVQ